MRGLNGQDKVPASLGEVLRNCESSGMSGGRLRGRLRKLLLERAGKDDRGSLGRQGQTGRGEKVGWDLVGLRGFPLPPPRRHH